MSNIVMSEVSDLLDGFDLSDIATVIRGQIDVEDDSDYVGMKVNHFQPIYIAYTKLMSSEECSDVDKAEAKDRFYNICNIILALIEKHFKFTITDKWLETNFKDIPAATVAFYSFFVIDLYANLTELIHNYVIGHTEDLLKIFNEMKHKKDSSSVANRKTLSPEMTLIGSNIYDIIDWILDNLDEQTFFDNLDDGYVALQVIENLYQSGHCSGEFVDALHNIYKESIALRSQLGYDILYRIKSGQIEDRYPKNGTPE